MNGITILGTGSYVPENRVDNHQMAQIVETSDEWIVKRTGINSRRFTKEENTSRLAVKAAERAIENSGVDPERIGFILAATFTPDNYTPSVACIVQQQLGLTNTPVMAFDLNAACSGFVYALHIASALLAAEPDKVALVIGAEVISKLIDFSDRTTCILFGDGAGAAVVAHRPDACFYSYMDARGDEQMIHAPSVNLQDRGAPQLLAMNGKEVFKFAVGILPSCIRNVLDQAGCGLEEIKYVVCHQANARILASAEKEMNARPGQFVYHLAEYGNTSAASIPLALDEMNRSGKLTRGDKLVLAGFGGGLTWGSILMEW